MIHEFKFNIRGLCNDILPNNYVYGMFHTYQTFYTVVLAQNGSKNLAVERKERQTQINFFHHSNLSGRNLF